MTGILLLAQTSAEKLLPLPEEGGFFSLAKVMVMVIFLFLWAWPAGWCSRDAKRLSQNQFLWGSIIIAGAVLGWFFWFILPVYAIGLIFFLMLGFGSILAYALYRDTIVEEKDKILKPANLMAAIKGEGKSDFKIEEKVRLATPEGKEPKIPEDADGQRIYQNVQDLLFDCLWRRTSEVYIQPAGNNSRLLFRIDGVISEYAHWDRNRGQAVTDYIKSICEMNIEEHRQPQKAKLVAQQVNVDRKVGLDIETAGSTAGEKLVIMVRAEEARFTIEDIGLAKSQLTKFRKVLDSKTGLIAIVGMPKTGLSTTLYAISRSLDAFTQNIHSVELKPLMTLDNITQNIHQTEKEASFDRLLQSVSRREPDIILVDPCPDTETAKMMGQIISTKKKKIYTALRASSTLSGLGRMVRWIGSPETAGQTLQAIVFQRLVRKLCLDCREGYRPNPDVLRKMNLASTKTVTFYRPPSQPIVDKRGNPIICPTCQGTGYLGRTAIFELLIVDDQLREAIRSGDATKIKTAAKNTGLKSWQQAAMEKVLQGITSVQEIVRVSKQSQKK